MRDTLSIVISAYNEEENISEIYRRLKTVVSSLSLRVVEYIFVDDGSTDQTFNCCLKLQAIDPEVKIVRLSRNFGHETAMTAGLDHASGEAVIFIDADLQHPPEYVRDMVRLWQNGHDVVLTRRIDNEAVSPLYKLGANIFYYLLNALSDTPIPANTPDFRLLGQKYINFLKSFDERDSLFRGALAWGISVNHLATIDFTAPRRLTGKSKYTLLKSLRLAFNSILQFSVKPLYLSMWLAALTALFALGLEVDVIAERYLLHNPTPGYATIVITTLIMGTINLTVLTIIGAYIAKIHVETKKRPLYLADFITAEKPLEGEAAAEPEHVTHNS
ncbi:MAG: hypothetical protein AMR96_02640 [Candidatus Adiutrix intracellularis]|jgi:dolichol-phosphate mannosyltransferase|nr:MAG: hypothetical protein AMR96_02640 [Candidatus Adiutrix intracellularis]MDR2826503.1 glycosyltransferase family 2 protein [Candidatus Adiutrix intracellularis]